MPSFDDLFPSLQGKAPGGATGFDDLFPPVEAITPRRQVLGGLRDEPQTGTLQMLPPGTVPTAEDLDVSAWEKLPRLPGEAAVSFQREAIGGIGAGLQGVGHWAKRLDELLPESLQSYRGMTEDQLVTAQWGKAASKYAAEKLPVAPEFEGSWLAQKIPGALGSAALFYAGGVTAAAAKGYTVATTMLLGALTNTGAALEQGRAAGLSEEDTKAYADVMGAFGVTEAAPIEKLLSSVSKPVQRLASSMLLRGVFGALEQAPVEGLQEGFMGLVGGMGLEFLKNPTVPFVDLVVKFVKDPEVWEQTGLGALVGALMGGGGAALTPRVPTYDEATGKAVVKGKPTIDDPTLSRMAGQLWTEDAERATGLAAKTIPSRKDVEGIVGFRAGSSVADRIRFSRMLRAHAQLEADLKAQQAEGVPTDVTEGIRSDQGQLGEPRRPLEEGESDRGRQVQQAAPGEAVATPPEIPQAAVEQIQPQPPYAEAPVLTEEGSPPKQRLGARREPVAGEPPPQLTSIKNAQVDEERRRRGLAPAMQAGKRSFGEVWDRAMGSIETDPGIQNRLIEELKSQPRALMDMEDALLLHKQVDLQNQYDLTVAQLVDIEQTGSSQKKKDLQNILTRLETDLVELYDVGRMAGTETGRGLNARKMLANESFEIVSMENQLRAAQNGKPVTPEQGKIIREISKKHKEVTAKLEARRAKVKQAEPEDLFGKTAEEIKKEVKKKPRKAAARVSSLADDVLATLSEWEQAAQARLRQKLTQISAGVDPTMIGDLTIIGASRIAQYGLNFSRWSSKMVGQFGNTIKPHLKEIFKKSRELIAQLSEAKGGKDNKAVRVWVEKGIESRKAKLGAPREPERTEKEKILLKIENKVKKNQTAEIGSLARKMARLFVEDGIEERKALLDAVHGELQKIIPEITRRETMDAISGYGQFAPLSKDEISVILRDLKGQYQQLAKLEDMQKGQPPLKTGVERRTPSDEERRLIQEVNEAKRKGGFRITDPATQLKTALDAVKTRLQHEIADLEYQIQTRTRIVKQKTPSPESAELTELRKRRDALRRRFDDIFGRKGISDEQRLKMAMESVRRSILDLQRRIETGDIEPKPRVSKTPEAETLTALKAEREALRQRLKELRQLAKPQLDAEELANRAYQARAAARIAELERRIAEADFAPRKKREFPMEPESLRLQTELEKVKQEWMKAKLDAKLAARTLIEKGFGLSTEAWRTGRATLTSCDASAIGRQGAILIVVNPKRAAGGFQAIFKSIKSEQDALELETELKNRPNYPLARQAGLFLAGHDSLTNMEEIYMSRWVRKIPVARESERIYIACLNRIRMDHFDGMVATLSLDGKTITLPDAQVFTTWINISTGRAVVGGKLQKAMDILNTWFFSPRLLISRFEFLMGVPLWRGPLRARKLVAREYGRFLIGAGLMLGMASLAGFSIEWDPRSSKFLKIQIGNSTIDIMAGLSQVTTLIGRIVTGTTKTMGGKIRAIRRTPEERLPYGIPNAFDVSARFLRTKLSPQMGAVVDLATGEDLNWEYASPGRVTLRLAVPISIQDIQKAIEEEGVLKGSALGLAALLGLSLQTYTETPGMPTTQKSRLGQRRLYPEARTSRRE